MLTADEQAYLDFALAALPRWMRADDPVLVGAAKMFGAVKTQIDYWFDQTLITHAIGATGTTPDWLNQHARDRSTNRQASEGDVTLRARLRSVPEALTRKSLLDAANAILAAAGVVGAAAMVELPRDGAFAGAYTADAGVGGAFTAGVGTSIIFTPTVPFRAPPYRSTTVIRHIMGFRLDISGAAAGANNGNRTITGLSGNGAIVTNAAGVVGADAGVAWTVRKLDNEGNIRDGFARAFASRGYRATNTKPLRIVIVLPFGSTVSVEASVRQMLREKKAAGFAVTVERRLNP